MLMLGPGRAWCGGSSRTSGRGREDTPPVPHDEHVPVALEVAALQGGQLSSLDLLPHGVDGQHRHTDAPSDGLLDCLVAADLQGDTEVGQRPLDLLQGFSRQARRPDPISRRTRG